MFAAMSHDNFTENENDVDGSRSKYKTCYQVEGAGEGESERYIYPTAVLFAKPSGKN